MIFLEFIFKYEKKVNELYDFILRNGLKYIDDIANKFPNEERKKIVRSIAYWKNGKERPSNSLTVSLKKSLCVGDYIFIPHPDWKSYVIGYDETGYWIEVVGHGQNYDFSKYYSIENEGLKILKTIRDWLGFDYNIYELEGEYVDYSRIRVQGDIVMNAKKILFNDILSTDQMQFILNYYMQKMNISPDRARTLFFPGSSPLVSDYYDLMTRWGNGEELERTVTKEVYNFAMKIRELQRISFPTNNTAVWGNHTFFIESLEKIEYVWDGFIAYTNDYGRLRIESKDHPTFETNIDEGRYKFTRIGAKI